MCVCCVGHEKVWSCWFLPGCVAGVCEGEVTHPQLVHGAQGAQAAVYRMTPLHSDETSCLVHAEGIRDVCVVQTREAGRAGDSAANNKLQQTTNYCWS